MKRYILFVYSQDDKAAIENFVSNSFDSLNECKEAQSEKIEEGFDYSEVFDCVERKFVYYLDSD